MEQDSDKERGNGNGRRGDGTREGRDGSGAQGV